MRHLMIPVAAAALAVPMAAAAQDRTVRTTTRTVVHGPDARMQRWSDVPGGQQAYRRPAPGDMLAPHWVDQRYYVGDYARYRLPEPRRGYRWQRYYDDAVMIGPDGRVVEVRGDVAWQDDGGAFAGRNFADGVYDDRQDDDRVYYTHTPPPPPPPAPVARPLPPRAPSVAFAPRAEVVQPIPGARFDRPTELAAAPPPPAPRHDMVPPPPAAHHDTTPPPPPPPPHHHASPGASYVPPPHSGHRMPPPPPAFAGGDSGYHAAPHGDADDGYYADDGYRGDDGYQADDGYSEAELVGYRDRYAPPPVVTHTGGRTVTTTTTHAGPGTVIDGWYYPPATTTTVVISGRCGTCR